ncbi:MAG: hypothetical protein Q4G60_14685 [bacterium]|nr:hypothetical protein [bacterium]
MRKNLKKIISMICLLSLCGSLCACAQKESPASTDETAQIPNPMVEITNAEDFNTKLGIPINPEYLVGDVKMYIIGDELAELTYQVENIEGATVECTLRAAKSDTFDSDICGVYDEMTESTEEYSADETITVTHKTPKTEPYQIYEFEYKNNTYCFMYSGDLSAMLFGELIDGVFCAIGAETAP